MKHLVGTSICVKDWSIEALNGDRLDLKRGKEYTTSPEKNGRVVVFGRFWVLAPASVFAGFKPGFLRS